MARHTRLRGIHNFPPISRFRVPNLIEDVDGNVYSYITIGTQQWLVENLKTTKYADGTAIPNLTLDVDWIAEDGTAGHDGAYCWYDNYIANKSDYGALYNWYAVDNAHGLADGQFTQRGTPSVGWRVATDSDWWTLFDYTLNDTGVLKEIGYDYWDSPNLGATNSSGFSTRGAGRRLDTGVFSNINKYASFLISDVPSGQYLIIYNTTQIHSDPNGTGSSVRCVRDII